ncbi:trichohyalin-like isoform X2 [Liolophura sinensis]|uniref:trichohyalin-like isoform X2 n=1 Tax=Liolophura sinensis TaxID=3198878 RepID=UPI003158C45C
MRAVECRREECVRLMIHDVDVNVKDVRGDTALHLAVREGSINITELLIKERADVNPVNKAGCTPLHLAVLGKREQIAHILLQEGADVESKDSNERTPLMLACQDGNMSMVKLLLQSNADTDVKDIKGWSADDIAVMQGHHSCSQLITDHTYQHKRPTSASSTPRSGASVFGGSTQNTPRQESTSIGFGAPVADMADDDSGDETVSRASGGAGGGYDSWNSDTDLSLATDDKKREEEVEEEVEGGPKVNLSKMVKNMSESDDMETPRSGAIPEEEETNGERSKAKVESQDSFQSQNSLQDQWSDQESPLARKRSATRVSFKRDEELSQVHNISAQDEESSDMEPQQRILNNGQPEIVSGYTSSASASPSKQTPEMSQEKMRGQETNHALMEELGISDADDISDVEFSEEVSIAEGNKQAVDQEDGGENAPRPGILKNWKQLGYTDETEIDDYVIPVKLKRAKSLEEMDDNSHDNGQDDNSEWDSDVEGLLSPRQTHMSMAKQEDSDWDSTVDAVTPRNQKEQNYQEFTNEEEEGHFEALTTQVSIEPSDLDLQLVTPVQSTPVKTRPQRMAPGPGEEEDEEESAWDSEDELSNREKSASSRRPPLSTQKPVQDDLESEEEESISEWEVDRQRQKDKQQAEDEEYERQQLQLQHEAEERQKEQETEQQRQNEEAERQRQMEAERQRQMETEQQRQREEAERQKQQEEAERQRQLEREAEQRKQMEQEEERRRQIEEEAERQRHRKDAAERHRQMEEEAERQRKWEEEKNQREASIAQEAEIELQRERANQNYQSAGQDLFNVGSGDVISDQDTRELHREELNNIHIDGVHDNLTLNQGPELTPVHDEALVRMSLQSDGNSYDEEDSMMSDNFLDSPRDSRTHAGLMSAGSLYANLGIPPDDDGLSYTSTEDFGGELQPVPYNRDILSGMTFGDSSAAIKLQDNLREQKRQLEKEKSQRMLMENKHRILLKDNDDLQRKVEDLSQQRSSLEQLKLDLESKNRSLAYNLNEETEKRKNADVLLLKIKEQLDRKEEQYTSEMEAKQKAELAMRNVQMELRSAQSTIKQLTDEKQDLERHLAQEKSARALQEQLNEEQQRRHRQLQQDTSRTTEALSKLEASDEGRKHAQDTVEKLRAEVYALKMELDRQRARFKDDHSVLANENEELQGRIDDLKNDLKLNEEALAHATMQYNVQLSSMRTENSMLTSSLEKERASKDKVETELESMRNRQHTASLELERSQQARSEAERMHQREKDDFMKQMDRREQELSNAKDNLQAMHQRATTAEAKLSTLENELHATNSSILEKSTLSAQLQRELDHTKSMMENLEENFRREKEQVTKLQVKLESAQDRVNSLQHENLTLKQQLETTQHTLSDRTGMDINDKFNAMLSSIKTDHDKSRSDLEEKNSSMSELVVRLREELRNSDNKKMSLEQELRHLNQDHNDTLKRLSSTEASLEVTQKVKIQLEQERNQLRMEAEKSAQKYEIAHDKTIELQARITELVDRLERAEHSSIVSSQQLAHSSANMQAFTRSRDGLEDSVHKLEVDKARLETELKHERQRVELLQRDLDDSQKVRSSLEALCSNLKTTNAHLEDKLGEETVTRTVLHQEAEDTKDMWEKEVLSRSKLGLRIAQLDRQKQDVLAQLEEEKRKVRKAVEAKRLVETKLEAEVDKNAQLQKEIAHLRAYLKSAKKKLRLNNIDDLSELQSLLQEELDQKDHFQSKNRTLESLLFSSKAPKLDKNRHIAEDERFPMENGFSDSFEVEQIKRELEAKYRMELNRKLEDVNRYLEEQAQARDRLDHVRNNNEASLKSEKRKLEDEVSELRLKFEQAVAEKQSKDLEARRFRDLYDGEMKWRMKLGDQLQRSTEKSYGYKSRLATEMQRSRIYGSVGNLSSPLGLVDSSPLDAVRVSNRLDSDDPLNRRLKAELDRSIAKHLEAGPHDNLKPVIRTAEDNPYLNSSLAKSNSDYLALLKKKYFV